MNLSAWAQQRAGYSKARHGRNEKGASLGECAAVVATATALGIRGERGFGHLGGAATPTAAPAA